MKRQWQEENALVLHPGYVWKASYQRLAAIEYIINNFEGAPVGFDGHQNLIVHPDWEMELSGSYESGTAFATFKRKIDNE